MLTLDTRTTIFDECQLHGLYEYETREVVKALDGTAGIDTRTEWTLRNMVCETIDRVIVD